jgi:hypothetical protein
MPSLFGLAPGGVCHAAAVTSRAVRFYRTVSTLPIRKSAVCFLWHFPSGYPGRGLPGTVPRWSPDFPPLLGYPNSGGRPTLWHNCSSRHPLVLARAARGVLSGIPRR